MSSKKIILMEGFYTILMGVFVSNNIDYGSEQKKLGAKTREEIELYSNLKKELFLDLDAEFSSDLEKWGASIDSENLTVTFDKDDEGALIVLFEAGSSEPTEQYKKIIRDFCPRYYKIIKSHIHKDEIVEINIGGHTSSEWKGSSNTYYEWKNNMKLSQQRSYRVMEECIESVLNSNSESLFKEEQFKNFTKKLTSNGYSSNFVKSKDGVEDKKFSRRVEFKIQTSFDSKLINL